jgi:hypothetical protein
VPLNLAAVAALRARLVVAVEEEADAILTVAVERIPKETETAAKSGRVVVDGETVYVSFGSDADRNPETGQPSNSYIEVLHEDLERHHPNGQALFLKSAADEAQAGMAERVATKARL